MARASAEAFVKVNFIADTKKAAHAFAQMHPHLAKLGRAGKIAGMAIAAGIGLAIAAFAALALAIKGALAKYDEYFTGIMKLSRVTGMTAKSASTLTGQLRLSGVEADKASKGFGILATKIYDARQGMKEQAAAAIEAAKAGEDFNPTLNTAQKLFADLGIKLRDSKGKFREIGDVIADVRDRISELDDRTEQVALAKKLLGKGGQELLPWLLKTKGEIAELTQKLRDMGMIKGEGAFAAFRTYKKNLRELSLSWDAIRINAAQALVPLINQYLPTVSKWIQQASKWLGRFATQAQNKGLTEAAKNMIPGVKAVGEWWQRNRKDIISATRSLGSAIKTTVRIIGPAMKVQAWLNKWGPTIGTAVRVLSSVLSTLKSVAGAAQQVGSALRSWSVAGLQTVLNVINAIAGAAQRALSYVRSLLMADTNNTGGKGFKGKGRGYPATGGIVTGPMSGYMAHLDGTELVVPMNGNPFEPVYNDYGSGRGGSTINVNVVVPAGTTLIGTAREVGEILAPHVSRALGREQARAGRRR